MPGGRPGRQPERFCLGSSWNAFGASNQESKAARKLCQSFFWIPQVATFKSSMLCQSYLSGMRAFRAGLCRVIAPADPPLLSSMIQAEV